MSSTIREEKQFNERLNLSVDKDTFVKMMACRKQPRPAKMDIAIPANLFGRPHDQNTTRIITGLTLPNDNARADGLRQGVRRSVLRSINARKNLKASTTAESQHLRITISLLREVFPFILQIPQQSPSNNCCWAQSARQVSLKSQRCPWHGDCSCILRLLRAADVHSSAQEWACPPHSLGGAFFPLEAPRPLIPPQDA